MDFLALSTDAIGFVGDFLGAVTQDVASHYLTNLVAQRLGQSEAGGQAFHRLQEQPGDQSRRIAVSGVLAEIVESDSQFAEQLFRAVEQAHRDQQIRVQQSSSQFYVGADQTVTTSGKGAIGIDFSTDYSVHNQTVNKRSRVVALGILGVIGALVLISFTLVQLIGDSEQSRAEDVAVRFARAAVMGDFVTACALFASDAPQAQSCFPYDYSTGPLSAELRRKAESVSAVSVQITSDTTARVLMTVPNPDKGESEEVFHLTLEDGHWKIFTTS